ncbi:RICIN domain-containing protein [Tunturiibacter lichenicola]|uniref:RICIN domain-containing protein n=1 Tax=Tunturiibacter lichenicola TaxID=2051959 RepID=UPI0021B43187|nr:RICIN domain-containing protein [Edaphobacter lichenicola]
MLRNRRLILLLSLILVSAFAAFESANAQTVSVYQTNADQSLLLSQQPSVSFSSTENGSTTITITPTVQYQQMDGFGASFTDSSAYLVYNKLTSAQQSALMQWFFSNTSGIGLNFLRQPMGASDFSAQGNFSYDDVASGQTDVSLTNFSIAKDLTYTIPVLKQAFAVNPNIKVEMLPWSPPAWMKTSSTMNGGNFNDTYYSALSQYFVKAIQAYQAQGIPVYSIAAQNEPENSNGSYPTETFSAAEEEAFISGYLGPALSSANLSTKIFGYEHNWGDTTYPEAILGNSGAYPYVAGTSWHCYSGSPSAQSTVETAYPNKGNWFTECSGETTGSFSGDLAWGMENLIIGATRNWAKSVTEWNLALDQNSGPTNGGCSNCRGFVTINDSTSPATITYNVENYLYGHAAKFVVPGAYRVESNSAAAGTGGIEDVAFQNPNGSMVLIAFNDATTSTTFDVNWYPNNTNFSYNLPAGAVATFTWTPSSSSGPVAPSNLAATATSSSQINLSWTASSTSGVTYSVFRSTSSGFSPSSSNQVASGLTSTSYSNTGLSSGTTYYYLVEAVASTGVSVPSNQSSATTTAVIPTAPTNLTATAASSAQINLSWTASSTSGVTYSVFGSTTSGFTPSSSNLIASGMSGTNYSATGLAASTTYYYKVEAVNSAGSSTASNQTSATTLAASGISTSGYYQIVNEASGSCLDDTGGGTSNGTVLQQYTCYGNNLNQEWKFTATSGGYYEVATYNTNTLAWNVVNSGTSPGTDMQLYTYGGGLNEQFEPAQLSTGYYEFIDRNSGLCLNVPGGANTNGLQLQISTCNGSTSESFTLNAITATAPAAPTALAATTSSSSQVNLSWTASTTSGVTYNVYGSTTSGFTPSSGNLLTSGLSATTYSNTGLTASTTYYYVVEAVNSVGSSPASNQASATTSATGGGSGISTTAYYTIVNVASGSCVDDTGGGTSNGTVLQQWTCSNNTNQEWLFTATGSGYYEVTTYNANTLAWNVVNVGTSPGTNMQLWTYGGGLNEQFEPVLLSTGYYEFIDRNSGLCLNVPGGATTNGLQLQINTCNGSTSESFKLNQL